MIAAKDPPISILIVSHNKPQLLPEAIESVLRQSLSQWQAILIDSGTLYDQDYFARFPWANDPRLRIVRSPETPELRRRKAMAPWCFNECFRRNLVQGELVMYLCDDDILYPNAFATFVDAFQEDPAAMAMYASQDISCIRIDGSEAIIGERRALAPGGKCCNGRIMDCQVDYLQLCHRLSALETLGNSEYWPEDIATGDHADGLFMEKLGTFFEILPIDVKVSQNRRTPWSVNLPANDQTIDSQKATPVHESVMNTWVSLKNHFEPQAQDKAVQNMLTEFQSQLRLLCEQDHAQRTRLVSRRYQFADKLHELLYRAPNVLSFLKTFTRVKTR